MTLLVVLIVPLVSDRAISVFLLLLFFLFLLTYAEQCVPPFLDWQFSPLLAYFDTLGFRIFLDRSIHDVRCRTFFTDVLGAGSWHRNILEHGLVFDWFHSAPFRYCEPNNKSATENLSQLRTTVLEWETGGFIRRVSDQPFCCNPMTVAVQPNLQTGVTKYRPCIDLSRHVNNFISPCPAKCPAKLQPAR